VNGRVSPFLELGVGFNPELTARENIFVNGALLGLSRSDLRDRLDSIIDFADLREFADQKLKNFSSGMQVRLAFSVAIQAEAEILLMDEVLAVGDARFQEKCFDIFWQYKRQGKTVVLVTHDLGAVENYCDRAILIDHGRVVVDGGTAEVTATYRRMVDASFAVAPATATPAHVAPQPLGDVRIAGVRLLDADGHPTQSVLAGGTLAMEIDIEAAREGTDVACNVDVHRADGLHLGGSSTRFAGLRLMSPPPGETRRVTFVVDRHHRAGRPLVAELMTS
jgi:ABC-type multidrug transport system ATPase subunit